MMEAWLIGHACELGHAGIKPVDLRAATRQLPATLRGNSELVTAAWLQRVQCT